MLLLFVYSLCQPRISSLEQSLTYLLSLKEIYDDLSQKDVESLSGRTVSSANSKILILRRNIPLFLHWNSLWIPSATASGLSSAGGAKGKSSWKLK
jgi:UDP-sugar transporter A1/2/3